MSKNYEPDARYRYRRDSYTKGDVDTLLDGKANVGDTYTKAEADALLDEKADTSDTYTKSQVDALIEESGGEKSVVEVSGTSYVISSSDAGKWLRFTSQDPVFVVWPIEAEFTTGQEVELFRIGGPVTVFSEWAQDVRFNGEDDFRLNAKYTQVRAVNGALNEWDCTYSGDVVFGVYQSPYYISNPGSDPMPVDPYYPDVSLLLNFEGADGSTTFTDSSPNGFTITPFGNVQIDTAQAPSGASSSGLFDGSGDYLTVPASTEHALAAGTKVFTISGYIRPTAHSGIIVFAKGSSTVNWSTGNLEWLVYVNPSSALEFQMRNGPTTPANYNGGSISLAGVWQHFEIASDGTTVRGFLDGVQVFSGSMTGLYSSVASPSLEVGRLGSAGLGFTGHMAPLRITPGVCRHTSAFTPPPAPYPTI